MGLKNCGAEKLGGAKTVGGFDTGRAGNDGPDLVKDHVVFFIEDNKHDACAIRECLKHMATDPSGYFQSQGIPLPEWCIQSMDGCAAQNKCRAAFNDISNSRSGLWVVHKYVPAMLQCHVCRDELLPASSHFP